MEDNIVQSISDDESDFLNALYLAVVKRKPDADGLHFYRDMIASKVSPYEILRHASGSAESLFVNNDEFFKKINEIPENLTFREACSALKALIAPNFNDFLAYFNILSDELRLSEKFLIETFLDPGVKTEHIPNFRARQNQLSAMDLTLAECNKSVFLDFTKKWVNHYFSLRGLSAKGQHSGVAEKLDNYIINKLDDISYIENSPYFDRKIYIGLTTSGKPSLGPAVRSLLDQSIFQYTNLGVTLVVNVTKNITLEAVKNLLIGHVSDSEMRYIRINQQIDYGPITKLVGTLNVADESESLICLADDEAVYPKDHFTSLVKYFFWLDEKFAVGTSGFNWKGLIKDKNKFNAPELGYIKIEGHLSNVDIVEAQGGVCLSKRWFDKDFLESVALSTSSYPDMMIQDDMFYSTYLEYKGVSRVILNCELCNRYDSGVLGAQPEIKEIDSPSTYLSKSDNVQMSLVQVSEWIMRCQDYIFNQCRTNKSSFKVAVATVCVGESYTYDVWPGMQSKARYCHKHGYDFIISRKKLDDKLPIVWSKIMLIQDLLENGYDMVYYADADVVITNPTKKIEKFFEKEAGSILVTVDINGLNIGNMLVANRPGARKILQMVMDLKEYHYHSPWYEQASLASILRNNADLSTKEISICNKNNFNSYISDWGQNDFSVHLAGVYGKYNKLLMRIIYDISRCSVDISEYILSMLSPFFKDGLPDPNRKVNLFPVKEFSGYDPEHDDVYISVNNKTTRKPIVVLGGVEGGPVPAILKAHHNFMVVIPSSIEEWLDALMECESKSIAIDFTGKDDLLMEYIERCAMNFDLSIVYTTGPIENLSTEQKQKLYHLREQFKNSSFFIRLEQIRMSADDVLDHLGLFLGEKNMSTAYFLASQAPDEGLATYFGYRPCARPYRPTTSPGFTDGFGLASLPSVQFWKESTDFDQMERIEEQG